MTKSDELLSEREDDSLCPAIANRRDQQHERGSLCNSHAAAACCRRLCARSLRRYFFCCLLQGGLFRIVRFRIAAQPSEFGLDHGGLVPRRQDADDRASLFQFRGDAIPVRLVQTEALTM